MTDRKVLFGPKQVNLIGNEVRVGDKAPGFVAIDQTLKPQGLVDYKGKIKLLSVFPSIDTGICSLQTRRFNQEAAQFGDKVAFIAISADLPFALKRFCGAEGINNLTPLSDHKDFEFGNKYGFHINELRLLARGVVIIDAEDIIRYIEILPEIGKEPDYDAAIKKLKELV